MDQLLFSHNNLYHSVEWVKWDQTMKACTVYMVNRHNWPSCCRRLCFYSMSQEQGGTGRPELRWTVCTREDGGSRQTTGSSACWLTSECWSVFATNTHQTLLMMFHPRGSLARFSLILLHCWMLFLILCLFQSLRIDGLFRKTGYPSITEQNPRLWDWKSFSLLPHLQVGYLIQIWWISAGVGVKWDCKLQNTLKEACLSDGWPVAEVQLCFNKLIGATGLQTQGRNGLQLII